MYVFLSALAKLHPLQETSNCKYVSEFYYIKMLQPVVLQPTWVLAGVPAVALPIQLPCNVSAKGWSKCLGPYSWLLVVGIKAICEVKQWMENLSHSPSLS